jgi:hypothetical protein
MGERGIVDNIGFMMLKWQPKCAVYSGYSELFLQTWVADSA